MTDSPQSAGGIARAAKLTPERRSEIASDAARRRWANPGPNGCVRAGSIIPETASLSRTPKRTKQGRKMADKISKTHHEAIEAMKDQLLIVLIERAGGEAAISAAEIDATGDRNLVMSLDGTCFHFAVKPKNLRTPGDIRIMRPDYDEH